MSSYSIAVRLRTAEALLVQLATSHHTARRPMNKLLIIDYYTDFLCLWGWIAQRRIDELNRWANKSERIW